MRPIAKERDRLLKIAKYDLQMRQPERQVDKVLNRKYKPITLMAVTCEARIP